MRDTNGEALGLSVEWRETERLLAQARASSTDSAQRNYAAHTELLDRLRSMLQTALERSQLILDQSVMIHYAVQSGFQQSPALIESLAVMRTLAVSALQRKTVTEEERQLLRGATERVRLYHAELAGTLERFLELAPELREPLTESIEQAKQAERFANIVEKAVMNPAEISMPAAPVASLGTKATKSVQRISEAVVDHIGVQLTQRRDQLARTRLILIVASAVLVLSACYLLVGFVRAVHLDLRQVDQRLADIASGVLTGQSCSVGRDEFAQLLRSVDAAQARLLTLIRDVQADAQRVDAAARQIAHENDELSERTERMASSLDRAGTSVLDLARSVNEGTTRITELDSMAQQSSEVATTAGRTVDQVVDRIRGIADASRRIEEIVATVDSITFQTRLLSLNAAVEAARAGEHGRGFGVVATEVRQLAARSQQASQEIRTLIQSSLAEVGAGTRLAADARAQMQRVVEAAQTLSAVIGQATQAASDQGRVAVQIAPLIQEVQADSERNAERVEQVKEATHALDSMAQSLKSSMARFQVDGNAQAKAA